MVSWTNIKLIYLQPSLSHVYIDSEQFLKLLSCYIKTSVIFTFNGVHNSMLLYFHENQLYY